MKNVWMLHIGIYRSLEKVYGVLTDVSFPINIYRKCEGKDEIINKNIAT